MIKHYSAAATLTVEQAAAILGIGRGTAYEAIRSGKLPSIRLARRLLVPTNALAQLLGSSVESLAANVEALRAKTPEALAPASTGRQ